MSNNKLAPTNPGVLPASAQPASVELKQQGNNNTQIAQVQNYHDESINTQNVFILPGVRGQSEQRKILQGLNRKHNYDYFHLFVWDKSDFDGPPFIVDKDRSLVDGTSPETRDRFADFTPEAIEEMKSFPAIFCHENEQYDKTSMEQQALFGYVTDIKAQDNGRKISYLITDSFRQQILNEHSFEMGIKEAKEFNLLNRNHWCIKRINIVEELEQSGIAVTVLN